jgi:DNA-binding MarR family transcriptional regulator
MTQSRSRTRGAQPGGTRAAPQATTRIVSTRNPRARDSRVRTAGRRGAVPGPEEALQVGPLIGRVRAVLLTRLDAELQPLGITGVQFGVLKNLAEGAADTAAELCRMLRYDTGSMTRMVDRLEARGFVRRERDKADRRAVTLHVTAAGRAALPKLRATTAALLLRMLQGFSMAEVDELKGYLQRMIANGQQDVA